MLVIPYCHVASSYFGINVSAAAGQSIHHLHIHAMPRYKGDVENPEGGDRGVIPDKQPCTFEPDKAGRP